MKFKVIIPASRIWDTEHTTHGYNKEATEQQWKNLLKDTAFFGYNLELDVIIGNHNSEFKVVFNGFRIEGALEERIRNIIAQTPIVYFQEA